jgi:hypothetical protein
VNPNCLPTVIAEAIGIWLMFCMPGQDQVRGARHDRLSTKRNRLLAGAALPVHGDTGNLFGVTRGQPGISAYVAGLPAALCDRVW